MNNVFLKKALRSVLYEVRPCKRKKPNRKMKTTIPICRDKKTRAQLRPTISERPLLLLMEFLKSSNVKNIVQLRISTKVASDRGLIPKEK